MNPAPRPPSPSARAATQRALRRENTRDPSVRDTRVLLGLNVIDAKSEGARLDSFFSNEAMSAKEDTFTSTTGASAPPRPSRQVGRMNSVRAVVRFYFILF